jgi:hypothetical protein
MDDLANDLSERDKLQKDVLWGYYVELRTHARQTETTRATAINYALLVASALIAVITLDKEIAWSDWPLCVVLVVVSLFTTVYSISYLERYSRNKTRSRIVLREIDGRFFGDQHHAHRLAGLRERADATEGGYDRLVQRISRMTLGTHVFWILVPGVIFLLSCFLLSQALANAP